MGCCAGLPLESSGLVMQTNGKVSSYEPSSQFGTVGDRGWNVSTTAPTAEGSSSIGEVSLERAASPIQPAAVLGPAASVVPPRASGSQETVQGVSAGVAASPRTNVMNMAHVMLQYRDLRPEDFELLMKLDEGVPRPGTWTADSAAALPTTLACHCGAVECGVCLQPLTPETVVSCLPCKHGFHSECITRWLTDFRGTCPLCTTSVLAPDGTALRPRAHTA